MSPLPRPRARAAALLSAAVLSACASRPAAGPASRADRPPRDAAAALERLLANDAAGAAPKLSGARDEPWAHTARALLARRALDPGAEAAELLALVRGAPSHPLALLALRRLAELAEESPALARAVDAGAAGSLAAGRLAGLAAYRARIARITAAEALGELDRAATVRAENGSVSAWTLAGPFGRFHALDFDTAYAPERGELPASVPAPPGLPARETRPLAAPDGLVSLDGEPDEGDIFYLAADADLARGGGYLLAAGSSASLKLFVDGALVAERRAFEGVPSTLQHVRVQLAPGRHRVLAKLGRGPASRAALHVALAREDGAPSDATFRAAEPGATAAARQGPPPAPVATPRDLARALEPGGTAVARLLAARDALAADREASKALLSEAIAAHPDSALLLSARAAALADDPTLDAQPARAWAETDLRRALELDAGDAASRVALAALQRDGQRSDDAEETLAALPDDAARRPAGLAARARLALARGLVERAGSLAGEAASAGGACDAVELSLELAVRRESVAAADEAIRAALPCPGGRERLARHLSQRGDPRGALEALDPVLRARPWAIDPALARAAARIAAGDAPGAVRDLEALLATWPRSARVARRLADARELAGDRAGARAARERALLLDPADLRLRRALALEDGAEVLAAEAQDGRAAIRAYEAAALPEETSTVLVLDAAAVEIHPGGAATERIHQVTHVVDQQGVEQAGEFSPPPGAELLALRTVKRDGRVVEPDLGARGKETLSLAGLEPGDYVDVEWLRADRDGAHSAAAGAYSADPFFFQVAGTPLFRSVYAVLAPEGMGLAADAHQMDAPEIRKEGGREVLRAERTRVAAFVPEPAAPAMTEFLPFVQVGVGGGRELVQLALADAVMERTRPTEEIRAYARKIRAEAGASATPEALVRAAYARVAADVLGSGGGLGDDASEVLSRGRGSRLALLQAVLAELGVEARVALARPFASDPAPYRFPSVGSWPVPLLRVRAGGKEIWLDPGPRRAPFGAIPASVLDCEAIVLPRPGEAAQVARTPKASGPADARDTEFEIALSEDGGAALSGVDRYVGHAAAVAKASIERLDAMDRRRMVEGMLARPFRGLALEEFSIEGEDDPAAPLAIRFRGRVPALARPANGGAVIDVPVLPFRLAGRYVQLAARTTPLLLPVPERVVQRVRIVPPAGLAARASDPVSLEGPAGRFARTERVEGGALVREERLEIDRARVSPADYPRFAGFAASVDEVQERRIELGR